MVVWKYKNKCSAPKYFMDDFFLFTPVSVGIKCFFYFFKTSVSDTHRTNKVNDPDSPFSDQLSLKHSFLNSIWAGNCRTEMTDVHIICDKYKILTRSIITRQRRGVDLCFGGWGNWRNVHFINTLLHHRLSKYDPLKSQNFRFHNIDTWITRFLTKLTRDKKYTCCKIISKEIFTHTVRKPMVMPSLEVGLIENEIQFC